jgi:hypothetical protein
MSFEIGQWTRSYQRVELTGYSARLCVVVDVRPSSMGDLPHLTLAQNAPTRDDLARTRAISADVDLSRVEPDQRVTMRLDSSASFSRAQLSRAFQHAIDSHLDGVGVEVMGLCEVGRPAGLLLALSHWVTVKGSGGRRPVTVPARVVATSHKISKLYVDGYGWTFPEYVTRWYRPLADLAREDRARPTTHVNA